ncbi:chalcone isomerase family protein [Simiduia sp. 21SJ11W-1]|uniref:chalcone isomerase family protein n=1 Tax=Simiduia sp. 21SJ11W-1 TaxID=2909669 RepID=UPI00209F35DD|nr:chalcone isomerase family protein [Simiduia sp. 21SJ11W-1]UTA47016.1 chalcone isomerase family protein [Simiduia sp. 21SJ11W-1]
MKRFFLLLVMLICALPSVACERPVEAPATEQLQKIGAAELRYWGIKIYRAHTFGCEGRAIVDHKALPKPFALVIHYHRDIDRQDLIETTRDEWQRLGLVGEHTQAWLAELRAIWQSVEAGDELTLWVDTDDRAKFYMNGQLLGAVEHAQFASTFAAIWLHPNARNTSVRNQLAGLAE